jgi:hypothetical protein
MRRPSDSAPRRRFGVFHQSLITFRLLIHKRRLHRMHLGPIEHWEKLSTTHIGGEPHYACTNV